MRVPSPPTLSRRAGEGERVRVPLLPLPCPERSRRVSLLPLFPMDIIRVSVSEAARLFGVSQRTVRRAIADGELVYVVVRGRYKINFESLVRWSQQRPHVKNKLAREGIGQFVEQWKIRNRLYSPNPKVLEKEKVR